MPRILSISYDEPLLRTREMLLHNAGYEVDSAFGFKKAIDYCRTSVYELVILGHSIPLDDKAEIIRQLRSVSSTPVLALERGGEGHVPQADFYADPFRPEEFVQKVSHILDSAPTAKT